MILNKMYNGFMGNTPIKKIYMGETLIFPEEKSVNINWNLTNATITSYNIGDPAIDNALDRPRINTFRYDGQFVINLSAGNNVYAIDTQTISQPWGNRSTGTYSVNIPLLCSLSAGVDFFTSPFLTATLGVPNFNPPLSDPNWVIKGEPTENENEFKYQYVFSRDTPTPIDIFIGYNPTNPTSPLNFTATPQDRQVVLNWEVPLSQGNTPISNYELQYSTNQSTWLTINTGNVTTYTLTGLTNNTNYYFRIRSINQSSLVSPYTDIIGPFMPYLNMKFTAQSLFGMSSTQEYVEIQNISPHAGRIDGWSIESHSIQVGPPYVCQPTVPPTRYTIPSANYIIPAGGTFKIRTGLGPPTALAAHDPPNVFGWANTYEWNDNGDVADLYDPIGNWIDTLATGDCLYDVSGYRIAYSNGAGTTVTSIPVDPDLATYATLDIVPTALTRGAGFGNSSGTLTGWRMRPISTQSTSLQDALDKNKTLSFNIQNINTGSVKHIINSMVDLTVSRNANGPQRVAVVVNKTNNWSSGSYTTLIDIPLPASNTSLDNDLLVAFQDNPADVTILPGETLYFRIVFYLEFSILSSPEVVVPGGAGSARTIRIRANNE